MKGIRWVIPLALLTCSTVGYGQSTEWIAPQQPLTFSMPATEPATDYKVFINNRDVTALIEPVGSNQLRYPSNRLPLPAGEVTLRIFEVSQDGWRELNSQSYRVLNKFGFQRSSVTTSQTLEVEAQLDAGASGDAIEPDPRQSREVSGYFNVSTDHARGDIEMQSSLNLVGVSRKENALQYGDKLNNAPKVDLSDYIATVSKGDLVVNVGHVNFGNNPLLVAGLANRGVSAAYRINKRIDVAITVQNGSATVGWNNFLGLDNSRHQIVASTLGIELAPSNPGQHKLEITHLDGKTQSISDFGVGEITDAERNRGWGITYQGGFWEDRIRVDSAIAESQYRNVEDQFLFQGDDVVATQTTTDIAWHVDLGLELVRPDYDDPLNNFATTLKYRKERADPFYRTLAAFVSADTLSESYALEGNFQYASWNLMFTDIEDNIDNLSNVLKTGTESLAFSLGFNVADWLHDANINGHGALWPAISLSFQRVHQQALNNPDADVSGFNDGSHLPDQVTKVAELSLDWSIGNGSIGYSYAWSDQDNRQIGRELSDFEQANHGINTSYNFNESLSLALSAGRGVNEDVEQQTDFISRHGSLNLQWRLGKGYVIDSGYSLNEDYTNIGLSESDSSSFNIGVSQQWQSHRFANPISVQWYVRYALQENNTEDQLFGFSSSAETWVSNAGLTVSF